MKKIHLCLIYSYFLRFILKVIVGVRISKLPKIQKNEQFIIVANHNSHLDTMALLAALPKEVLHKVRPVAARDHFGKNKLSRVLSHFFINALLIQRKRDKENPNRDPIHQMLQALDKGQSLIVFPEGSRGLPDVEQEIKAGIALVLAQRPEISLIPAYMKGFGFSFPKGSSYILPFTSSLIFGPVQKIRSLEINAILNQIKGNFQQLSRN